MWSHIIVNKIDGNVPEYYALECCVSDEKVDVALAIGAQIGRMFGIKGESV